MRQPHMRLATQRFYRHGNLERGDIQLRVHTRWREDAGLSVREVLQAALLAKFCLADAGTGAPTADACPCSVCDCRTPIELGVFLPGNALQKKRSAFGHLSAGVAEDYAPIIIQHDESGDAVECFSLDASIVLCSSSAQHYGAQLVIVVTFPKIGVSVNSLPFCTLSTSTAATKRQKELCSHFTFGGPPKKRSTACRSAALDATTRNEGDASSTRNTPEPGAGLPHAVPQPASTEVTPFRSPAPPLVIAQVLPVSIRVYHMFIPESAVMFGSNMELRTYLALVPGVHSYTMKTLAPGIFVSFIHTDTVQACRAAHEQVLRYNTGRLSTVFGPAIAHFAEMLATCNPW
eukprot:TRINITY_DN7566_c0_g1_i1.p1 TRINITY_DN7566_c0_g1~~TRINITY_DN7566_c0_g1_i1.p1  ORF type:complete len:366 (+),score=65.10 TRINITY_DN7566_c0_g1_i1:59-1099(+)